MNEMKKLSIVWGIVLVMIVAGLTVFGFVWKNKQGDYKDAEKSLQKLAQNYKDAATISKGAKIMLDELIEADLIDELKVNDEICDGYVSVENNGLVYEYKAYIKCDNYTTKGY